MFKTAITAVGLTFLLSGCGSTGVGPHPGNSYSSTPPQLTTTNQGNWGWTENPKAWGWDHPEYFGPVPAHLQATGDRICNAIDAKKAIGYHPQAKDSLGHTFQGGGYFCKY